MSEANTDFYSHHDMQKKIPEEIEAFLSSLVKHVFFFFFFFCKFRRESKSAKQLVINAMQCNVVGSLSKPNLQRSWILFNLLTSGNAWIDQLP